MDKKQKGVEFYQNNFDKYEIRKKGMIDDKKMDGLFKYNNLSSKLCSKLTARSSSICRKSKKL